MQILYSLFCKAERQYLLTCKVSRYCLLALHGRIRASFKVAIMPALYFQKSRLDGIRLADGVTIAWRQYVLDTHVENDIEDDVLDLIRADLDIVRNARFTVLLRFMYTDTQVTLFLSIQHQRT